MADEVVPNNFLPDYASYNWVGAPAGNFEQLTTNAVGGDSSECYWMA